MFQVLLVAILFSGCLSQSIDDVLARMDRVEQELRESISRMDSRKYELQQLLTSESEASLDFVSETSARLTHGMEVLHSAISDYQAEIMMNVPIGFSAYATSSQSYSQGQTIEFPGVITNVAFNYHPDESTFIVAHDGLYMFTTTIFVESYNAFNADIVVNNVKQVQAYAADINQRDQASALVFAICAMGDLVTVQAGDVGGMLTGHGTDHYTTFSGMLVIRL